jgi:hypothetical protein
MAKKDSSLARAQGMVHPFRVTKGKHFRPKDVDPADTRAGTSCRA